MGKTRILSAPEYSTISATEIVDSFVLLMYFRILNLSFSFSFIMVSKFSELFCYHLQMKQLPLTLKIESVVFFLVNRA